MKKTIIAITCAVISLCAFAQAPTNPLTFAVAPTPISVKNIQPAKFNCDLRKPQKNSHDVSEKCLSSKLNCPYFQRDEGCLNTYQELSNSTQTPSTVEQY